MSVTTVRFSRAVLGRWLQVGLVFASLSSGLAWAQVSQPSVAPPVAVPLGQDTLSRAAASVGIQRCLPAISRLAGLNVQGSRAHDVLLDWDRQRPDAGPVFSLIGLEYPNAGMAASVTAVPNEATGTCTVAAERITVAPFTCASIAQTELATYQMARLLPVYAVYTDPSEPGSSVSLIDSPPGCLVIRRFIEYHWKDPGGQAIPPGRR